MCCFIHSLRYWVNTTLSSFSFSFFFFFSFFLFFFSSSVRFTFFIFRWSWPESETLSVNPTVQKCERSNTMTITGQICSKLWSSIRKKEQTDDKFGLYIRLAQGRPVSRTAGQWTTELDSGTQKHLIRSPSKATGHTHRPARVALAEVGPQASTQAGARGLWCFSKSAILHRFPKFYTLRVKIFRMFFIRSRLHITPMDCEKFHGNRSAWFSKIRKTDTHAYRCGNFMWNTVCILWPLVAIKIAVLNTIKAVNL